MVRDREEVIRLLHQLAHAAVCGQAPWPASRETCESIYRMLAEAGLEETTPNGSIRSAPGIDDLLTFVGVWDPWDVPIRFAFDVSDEDVERMEFAPSEAEALQVIKQMVVDLYEKRLLRSTSRQ
jgi:hypothetical protein